MYNPVVYIIVSLACNDPSDSLFTQDEIAKYAKRKEEGFDVTTDLRYNYWLSLQPTPTSTEDVATTVTTTVATTRMLPPQKTILTSILKKAPSVYPPDISKPKSSARVVTSEECCKEINDKHLKKLEEARLREMRKLEREKKRMEKEEKKKKGMKLHVQLY